jgi:AhpD family alkylhydroperoxidase
MPQYIKYVTAVEVKSAQGLVARTYSQMKSDPGVLAEPFTLHSPVPALLAGVWGIFRESLLTGQVRRGVKEAVAAVVSEQNRCLWCVDAHSIALYATGDRQAVQAILQQHGDEQLDTQMQAAIRWASATRTPTAAIITTPPFSAQVAPEMLGVAVTFHYLNRLVSIVLAETNLPRTLWLKQAIKRALGWLYAGVARQLYPPGRSLDLLPEAPLPGDLAWAAGVPSIAGAFARFAAQVEAVGKRVLAPDVRTFVQQQVHVWAGDDPGLSRQWVERALEGVTGEPRAASRLALLAALAPYQMDDEVIQGFRTYHPGDDELLGALAWASFTAARRIGGWLYAPSLQAHARHI